MNPLSINKAFTKKAYWICQAAGWSTYVISGSSMTSIITGEFQFSTLLTHAFAALVFFLITHISRYWLKERKVFRKKLYAILGVMAGFVLLSTSVGMVIVMGTLVLVDPARTMPGFSDIFMSFVNTAITFTVWISFYAAYKIFSNYRENEVQKWKLEARLLESEIAALKAQVNPHFIFNSLNNIRSLVAENPEKAREAITTLSKLLRVSFRFENELVIPLEEELEMVKKYLHLEKIHHEERLKIHWNVSAVKNSFRVPALGIQTLVENAIKHGISSHPDGGELRITTRAKGEKLSIQVTNTGRFRKNGKSGRGTGLKNLEKRLKLYDERSEFKIEPSVNKSVTAEILLYPCEDRQ